MIISRPCDHCQVQYQADTRYLNRGQGQYCSRSCSGKSIQKSRRKYYKPNIECSWCKTPIYRKPNQQKKSKTGHFFCCKAHQSLAFADPTHPVFSGPEPSSKIRKIKYCSSCGLPYGGEMSVCTSCRHSETVNKWLAGDNSVTLPKGKTQDVKNWVKRYLISTRGDKCEQCGFDEKAPDGRSIIQMDHIDGNSNNNLIENLRLLCPNHHAMTPNYGSLNKGSGRSHRRKTLSGMTGD